MMKTTFLTAALLVVGMLFDDAHGWIPTSTNTKTCSHALLGKSIPRIPYHQVNGWSYHDRSKTCFFAKPKAGSTDSATGRSPASSKREETWRTMVERLEDYKLEWGNIDVPYKFNDGLKPHLGSWVCRQREKYRKGSLSQDEVSRLESLGIKWAWSREDRSQQSRDDQIWNSTFKRLITYKQQFGNTLVHFAYNDGGKPLLGKWVAHQRTERRIFVNTEGTGGSMTQERIDKLNSIGFIWNDVQQLHYQEQWMQHFDDLKEFQAKYNSTKVPVFDTDSDDPITSLGVWVWNQISEFNKLMANKTSLLTIEKVEIMNSTNFAWTQGNKTEHEKWLYQYFRLYYHHFKYNNTAVSDSDAYSSRFVNWVAQQKQDFQDGKLDQSKIDLLNELGFDWTIDPEPSWDEYYFQLCEYHTKYNTTLLNKRINSNLAKWCKQQRKLYGSSKLAVERILKLEALNFDWDPEDEDWNAMYHRLLAYEKRHGNVLVPVLCAEDPPLGQWMRNQHRVYSQFMREQEKVWKDLVAEFSCHIASKKVPAEVHVSRLSKLVEVGFVWDRKEVQWLGQYQKLVAFKQSYKTVLVPVDYEKDPSLGVWVSDQRCLNTAGKLEPKRKNLLDEICFEWDPLEAKWCEMFGRLCLYKEEKGNANVPSAYADDPELAYWVERQRKLHRSKRIAPHRIEKLESIGFEWRIRYK